MRIPLRPGLLRRRRKNCENAGWAFGRKAWSVPLTPSRRGEVDLGALADKPTAEARERLCLLPGVGRKVANCVLLFAYERLEAVPVDVWIARILRTMHKGTSSLLELEEFSNRRFGSYAGYIQQYLFHHARMSKTLPA